MDTLSKKREVIIKEVRLEKFTEIGDGGSGRGLPFKILLVRRCVLVGTLEDLKCVKQKEVKNSKPVLYLGMAESLGFSLLY